MDYLRKIKFLQAAAFLGHACYNCCLAAMAMESTTVAKGADFEAWK
jgi:hypothetical protein